jgi:hypothetical protein
MRHSGVFGYNVLGARITRTSFSAIGGGCGAALFLVYTSVENEAVDSSKRIKLTLWRGVEAGNVAGGALLIVAPFVLLQVGFNESIKVASPNSS